MQYEFVYAKCMGHYLTCTYDYEPDITLDVVLDFFEEEFIDYEKDSPKEVIIALNKNEYFEEFDGVDSVIKELTEKGIYSEDMDIRKLIEKLFYNDYLDETLFADGSSFNEYIRDVYYDEAYRQFVEENEDPYKYID